SSGGAVVGLDKLRGDPSVSKQGGVWRLPLTEQDRGKIGIDNITVLFQFVPPPPVQAVKPIERMDFRPVMFDEDDPAFFGFLALFTALAIVFAVGIYLAPPPAELSFSEIDDRFTTLVIKNRQKAKEKEKVEKEKVEEDLSADKKKAKVKAKTEDKQVKAKSKKPKNKVDAAKQRERRKANLRKRMRIANIGTRGRSSSGQTVADFGDKALLRDLSGIGGDEVAIDGSADGTRGGNYGADDIDVEDNVDVGDAGSSSGNDVPALDMSNYKVEAGSGDTIDVEGADNVEAVIRKRSGQLQYCYEEQLRGDPSLGGRVEVQFQINNMRVTTANIVNNTTGNDALAQCILKKVKRWRFAADTAGAVSWPFVFRKR
ncbi:MAG: outer membrane biosynthesis protein TonB, partial [Kiritimatiellia bacterium]